MGLTCHSLVAPYMGRKNSDNGVDLEKEHWQCYGGKNIEELIFDFRSFNCLKSLTGTSQEQPNRRMTDGSQSRPTNEAIL